jgi:hypothetical protein
VERIIDAVLDLFGRAGRCFVATADVQGLPHLATASRMEDSPDGRLRVLYWFCPRTVENLQHNRRVSITVWDPGADEGYQILGTVERVADTAYLDGFDPESEEAVTYPSVERELVLLVDEVLAFRHAPHGDRVLVSAPAIRPG